MTIHIILAYQMGCTVLAHAHPGFNREDAMARYGPLPAMRPGDTLARRTGLAGRTGRARDY